MAFTVVPKPIIVTKRGTLLENVSAPQIIVRAPGVLVRNCEVTGTTLKTNMGLVDCTHKDAGAVLEHVRIQPKVPSLWMTGVLGHNFTARDVTIRHTVDGFGVYNTHSKVAAADVLIDDCDVDELAYFVNDPNHSDRHTHNDCVQIQGGSHIKITNSKLHAFAAPRIGDYGKDPYRPAVTGQAIGVTPNVSKVSWLHIQGNDLDGGAQAVTMIPGKFGPVNIGTVQRNRFGTRSHRRPVAIHPSIQVTWADNVYMASGRAVPVFKTKDL